MGVSGTREAEQAGAAPESGGPAADLRQDVPHSARMYDYYLGGKTNYRVDREAVGKVIARFPHALTAARANRAFMHRATRFLAEHGIRQWLDVGTGIPTSPNLHEVAQSVAPEARVVYVDNDPIVLAHSRALMSGAPEGRTAYLHGDLRDPRSILDSPEVRRVLDLSRPVAVNLVAVMHFVGDEDDPYGIVRALMAAMPSGSALVLGQGTSDFDAEALRGVADIYTRVGTRAQVRNREEVLRFFDALDLVEPGLVPTHRWRPDRVDAELPFGATGDLSDLEVAQYVGVALKP